MENFDPIVKQLSYYERTGLDVIFCHTIHASMSRRRELESHTFDKSDRNEPLFVSYFINYTTSSRIRENIAITGSYS